MGSGIPPAAIGGFVTLVGRRGYVTWSPSAPGLLIRHRSLEAGRHPAVKSRYGGWGVAALIAHLTCLDPPLPVPPGINLASHQTRRRRLEERIGLHLRGVAAFSGLA
jgi:hypothetical protein